MPHGLGVSHDLPALTQTQSYTFANQLAVSEASKGAAHGKVSSQAAPGVQHAALILMFPTSEEGVGLKMKQTEDR